ncbi:uncharacterized protein KZ484_025845 [Pholidichthys leucotaenia]
MRIKSSSDNKEFSAGETITLSCTSTFSSTCSSHKLNITWFRDGHPLLDTGPSFRIDSLTAKDSGNYSCALENNKNTKSKLYNLQVKEEPAQNITLIVGVVVGVLLVLVTLPLFIFFIRRKLSVADDHRSAAEETEPKHGDNISSSMKRGETDEEQEGGGCGEEVSYASVQFQQRKKKKRSQDRQVKQTEDSVIYSSVAMLG